MANVNSVQFATAAIGYVDIGAYEFQTFLVGDPLTVINTNDSGAGSLRAAVLYANTLGGATHTITFVLPSGPQTINLLSPLPATTVAVVALLDATQNVTVKSPLESGVNHYNSLSKIGAGTLTIAGRNSLSGPFAVHAGLLQFNDSVAPQLTSVGVTVNGSAILQLAGAVSALAGGASGVHVSNNSTAAAGLDVTGNIQIVGVVDGTGNVVVEDNADLTANDVNQNSLVIGAGATMTIDASDANGNPLAGAAAIPASSRANIAAATGLVASAASASVVSSAAPSASSVPAVSPPTTGESVAIGEPRVDRVVSLVKAAAASSAAMSGALSAGRLSFVSSNCGLIDTLAIAPSSAPSVSAPDPISSAAVSHHIVVSAETSTLGFVVGSSCALARPTLDPAAIDFALAESGDGSTISDDSLFDLLAQSISENFSVKIRS